MKWRHDPSFADEGTFWSGAEGISATTAFQHPRGPFHLRMLGRIGWFSSVQNCKDRAQVGVCPRLKHTQLVAAGGASKCLTLTHQPHSEACRTTSLFLGFVKTQTKKVPQIKKQTTYKLHHYHRGGGPLSA